MTKTVTVAGDDIDLRQNKLRSLHISKSTKYKYRRSALYLKRVNKKSRIRNRYTTVYEEGPGGKGDGGNPPIISTDIKETVVLLSHKKADSYIHIDVEFGEGEGKIPVDSIAKRAEAYKPKEKVTYKMIKEYIEAKYGFKVHTAYIAEVKRNLGLPMYDAPNAVEELKQPRKHPTPEKVEAIKDALRYFAVI